MSNEYEQRQERRRARLEARADRLRTEGEARIQRGRDMASIIPLGQPILVGHHSEKRDRNYRGRIRQNFEKGFETLKAADAVEQRAASVGLGGVSSDDPDAIIKLREQLAEREARQARMVAALAAWRSGGRQGAAPFAPFELSNNNANVRRITDRIRNLERAQARETSETEVAGVRLVQNVEANRVQLIFPGKPADAVRALLKSRGFRWSPTEGAWQRHLNNAGIYAAREILKTISKGD